MLYRTFHSICLFQIQTSTANFNCHVVVFAYLHVGTLTNPYSQRWMHCHHSHTICYVYVLVHSFQWLADMYMYALKALSPSILLAAMIVRKGCRRCRHGTPGVAEHMYASQLLQRSTQNFFQASCYSKDGKITRMCPNVNINVHDSQIYSTSSQGCLYNGCCKRFWSRAWPIRPMLRAKTNRPFR